MAMMVAGLLGITVIGAGAGTSQAAALRAGPDPAHAFVGGYHCGLWVTIALLAAGAVVSYVTLRPAKGHLSQNDIGASGPLPTSTGWFPAPDDDRRP